VFFGNVIGRRPYFQVEGTLHHMNEYVVTVGETGVGRKGTAGDLVRYIFSLIDEPWEKARIQEGLSSGEGLITPVRDPVESRVAVREKGKIVDWQVVVSDPGIEDKRLLILETEFGGVIRALEREGNKLSSLIRTAWDGKTLRTLTKCPHVATNPHVSMVGHITFDELKLLDIAEMLNGFANRIWWFAVHRQRSLPFGRIPELTEGLNAQAQVVAFARTVDCIGWAPDARDLWQEQMYESLVPREGGLLASTLNRAQPHVLRVASMFALADRCTRLEVCHLRAAKALWDASARCAGYIFGDRLSDPNAEKILAALDAIYPEGLTRTEISVQVFQRHLPAQRIKDALASLLKAGAVREQREATGGAPVHRYFRSLYSEISEISEFSPSDKCETSRNGGELTQITPPEAWGYLAQINGGGPINSLNSLYTPRKNEPPAPPPEPESEPAPSDQTADTEEFDV
jgi:hypothetical protein